MIEVWGKYGEQGREAGMNDEIQGQIHLPSLFGVFLPRALSAQRYLMSATYMYVFFSRDVRSIYTPFRGLLFPESRWQELEFFCYVVCT
jgi:hypothetical protein